MQKTGLSRNTIDKYYTNNATVKLCMNTFKNHVIIDDDDIIIEPSAGNGAFIDAIKEASKNSMFLDIEPEHSEIITNERLLELNKQVILQVKSNISVFLPRSVESLQDIERVLVFDRNFEMAKKDFDTLNAPQIPKTPDFLLPDDEPLR